MGVCDKKEYIYLARHGETDWNRSGRWQGQTDIPLNDAGRLQATGLGDLIQSLDLGVLRVHSSDLSRARETGEIVAGRLGVPFVSTYPELRERNFGVLEGLTQDEVAVRFPDVWAAYNQTQRVQPPGAEPHAEVAARMQAAAMRVHKHDTGPALIVTHGGALRILVRHALGEELPPVQNGAVYRLRITREHFVSCDLVS